MNPQHTLQVLVERVFDLEAPVQDAGDFRLGELPFELPVQVQGGLVAGLLLADYPVSASHRRIGQGLPEGLFVQAGEPGQVNTVVAAGLKFNLREFYSGLFVLKRHDPNQVSHPIPQ
jgi:hypothetical protein